LSASGKRTRGHRRPEEGTRLPLHKHLGHLLRRAHQRDRTNFIDHTRGHDVTPQQYAVLLTLRELGPSSQRRIGEHVAMEPGNLHYLLQRIAERGLITIRPSAGDKRRNELHLMDLGAGLLDQLRPLAEQAGEATLAPLSPSERSTLLRLLEKVAMSG
jgi:DNA-binding MarR family transcriptional regulator